MSGPLRSTSAYLTKVATSPAQESANYQHLICVYIPDVYDKASVTEVPFLFLYFTWNGLRRIPTGYESIAAEPWPQSQWGKI